MNKINESIKNKLSENGQLPKKVETSTSNTRKIVNIDIKNGERNEIENSIFLNARSLTLKNNTPNGEKVIMGIRQIAVPYINLINMLLPNENEKIKLNEKDSVETLIWKSSSGVARLQKLQLLNRLNRLAAENPLQLYEDDDLDALFNARICWRSLKWIFERYFELEIESTSFVNFEFEKNNNIIVEGIASLIDGMIIHLEKIKEETFLATFRILMDPDRSCLLKLQFLRDFLNISYPKNTLEQDAGKILSHPQIDAVLGNIAYTFAKLQILLDCLNKLKQTPKTYGNMKKGYDFLKEVCIFYKNLLPLIMRQGNLLINGSSFALCPYYTNCTAMYSYLQKIENEFLGILNSAFSKNSDSLFDVPTPSARSKKARQRAKKAQAKQNLMNQDLEINNQPSTIKSEPSQKAINTKSLTEILEPKVICKKVKSVNEQEIKSPTQLKESIPTEPKEVEQQRSAIDLSEIIAPLKTLYIEEEDPEIIKIETNSLMELMRQICEKDRQQKIINQNEKRRLKELRELELKKAALSLEAKPNIIIEKKAEVRKLNKKHEATLTALLSNNPPHLVISGKDVEFLITSLNGKLIGDGNGSRFKVYWKGSDKSRSL